MAEIRETVSKFKKSLIFTLIVEIYFLASIVLFASQSYQGKIPEESYYIVLAYLATVPFFCVAYFLYWSQKVFLGKKQSVIKIFVGKIDQPD